MSTTCNCSFLQDAYNKTYRHAIKQLDLIYKEFYFWDINKKQEDICERTYEEEKKFRKKYIYYYKQFKKISHHFQWCIKNKSQPNWRMDFNFYNPEEQEKKCQDIMRDLAARIVCTFEGVLAKFPEKRLKKHKLALYEYYKRKMI